MRESRYSGVLLGVLVSTIGDVGVVASSSPWFALTYALVSAGGALLLFRAVDHAYSSGRSDEARDWFAYVRNRARNGSEPSPTAPSPTPATPHAK